MPHTYQLSILCYYRRKYSSRNHVRQQNNTKGMRTQAPRAPLGSPPAADTRPGVLQQTRAVWGAGAALPRCPGPRSADLKRAPSNFSKSGRDGRRGIRRDFPVCADCEEES